MTLKSASQSEPKVGRFVEADVNNIHEGQFKKSINEVIRAMVDELERFERETADLTGKVTGSVNMELKRVKGSDEFFDFGYTVQVKIPKRAHTAMVKGAGGRLLIDPEGDSLNDADQLLLLPTFDRFGNPQATVNKSTGEVLDPDDASGGASMRIDPAKTG
jgi:hypothetical protein